MTGRANIVSADLDGLRREIQAQTSRLFRVAGIPAAEVSCSFETDGSRLRVVLHGPPVPAAVERALAVRVLDAVRGEHRTYGEVDVSYDAPLEPRAFAGSP